MLNIQMCYLYIESEQRIQKWADLQNCEYHVSEMADKNDCINGKRYWMISQEGKIIMCTDVNDYGKQWNFKNNKPID